MTISKDLIERAIVAVAAVPQVEMAPRRLAEDALLLAQAFTQEDDYLAAVTSTCRALRQLVVGAVTPADLRYDFAGWQSFHYQHKVGQGLRADMRVVFQKTGEGLRVLAFGHRNLPHDFYERLAHIRSNDEQDS